MPALSEIDTADYILRHHSATASVSAASTNLRGVGAALFLHTEGTAVKPDTLSSHMFTFRCAGAQTRRIDKPRNAPGTVGVAGMTLFLAADEMSKWECEGDHELVNVFLGTQFLADLAGEAFGVDGARVQYKDGAFHFDDNGTWLGRMVEHRLRGDDLVTGLEVDAWANLVGLHALRRYSSVPRRVLTRGAGGLSATKLRIAVEFMSSNLSFPLRLSEIAGSVGMSQFSFARAFRCSTGITPHQHLTNLRIKQAQEYLASGTLSLSEIAVSVGFADQSHLTAQFRKALGVTPARYRRACRG